MLMIAVKLVGGIAAGLGASTVVTNAVIATTPANLTRAGKVMVTIGGTVISSVVGGVVYDWTWDRIEELETDIKTMNENRKEKKELKKQERVNELACKGSEA